MATNIRKNVKILTCNACKKQHIIEKEMTDFSFECEGCKNEIFVDESGNQIIIGNLKTPVVDAENLESDNKSDKKANSKEIIETDEKNEFSLT